MFLGTYEHNMDEKGRVALPVRFRDMLVSLSDCRVVLTTNMDPSGSCLVGYPIQEWQAFHEKISSLPQFDENVIRLRRLHFAGACELTPDRQGRVLIPGLLREYAGLKDSVIFAGLGTHIELWDRFRWQQERDRAKQDLAQISNALGQFGL